MTCLKYPEVSMLLFDVVSVILSGAKSLRDVAKLANEKELKPERTYQPKDCAKQRQ